MIYRILSVQLFRVLLFYAAAAGENDGDPGYGCK